jgi:hypothetical protein
LDVTPDIVLTDEERADLYRQILDGVEEDMRAEGSDAAEIAFLQKVRESVLNPAPAARDVAAVQFASPPKGGLIPRLPAYEEPVIYEDDTGHISGATLMPKERDWGDLPPPPAYVIEFNRDAAGEILGAKMVPFPVESVKLRGKYTK